MSEEMIPSSVSEPKQWEGNQSLKSIRWLIYGDSGAGKTVLASTFPDPLFLDADNGLASVRAKIRYWTLNSWSDLQNAYRWLRAQYIEGKAPCQTLVLDTVNEIQRMALRNAVQEFPTVKRSYGSQPDRGDYGKAFSDVDNLVRALRALPIQHLVLLTEVDYREYEDELIRPGLLGKSTVSNLCQKMDIIGYLEVVTVEGQGLVRRLTFDSSRAMVKDRLRIFPAEVPIPEDAGFSALAPYLYKDASAALEQEAALAGAGKEGGGKRK